MSNYLTRVHVVYGRDKFNYYTRFGAPRYRKEQTAAEKYEYYTPGEVLGYVRWQAGKYGTQRWRFLVLRTGDASTTVCTLPGVEPGAEVLADISGKDRVHRLFEAVDAIEALGIAPDTVAPWYWVQCNASLNSSLKPSAYTSGMHRAWLQESELGA